MEIDYEHSERFSSWLLGEAVAEARGTRQRRLTVAPEGRFWLGRLAPTVRIQESKLGERAERLEPCEVGIRVRPSVLDGHAISCRVSLVAWRQIPDAGEDPDAEKWEKTDAIDVEVKVDLPRQLGDVEIGGRDDIARALTAVGADGLSAEVHAEVEAGKQGPELALTIVNVSPAKLEHLDTNLYEVEFEADVGPTFPFVLDNLPDSFRYDRRVPAYGINGGVTVRAERIFATADLASFDRRRPDYWDEEGAGPIPDLSIQRLAGDDIGPLHELTASLSHWTETMWSDAALLRRNAHDEWDDRMLDQARREAEDAQDEVTRIERGVELLEQDDQLRRSFALANRAFAEAPGIEHDTWRPFQLGFLLANLAALPDGTAAAERAIVDTLWFATGGGKTETYLLYTLTAAFYDRMRGKRHGITSWGRFPLRMLSLQVGFRTLARG